MNEQDGTAASREMPIVERKAIADALVHAMERRHEVLDAVVASDDYDAASDSIASPRCRDAGSQPSWTT